MYHTMTVPQLLLLLFGMPSSVRMHPTPRPAVNHTLTEPAWGPEPSGRGTAGILTSCSLTLILCVCTVLHLDICPGRTTFQQICYKLKYVTLGVFAPEVLLIIAIRDYLGARELRRNWQLVPGFSAGSEGDYGLEGAFFANMGGFVLRRPGGYFKTALATDALLRLSREGLIEPDFTTSEIVADKGKSDLLAKCLVCMQAVWLIVQCAARLGVGLPLTLLEIHILVHVLCTLVMYACWMKKPLDVAEQLAVMADTDLASLIIVDYARLHIPGSELHIEYSPSPVYHPHPSFAEDPSGCGQKGESSASSYAGNERDITWRSSSSSSPSSSAMPDGKLIFIPEQRSPSSSSSPLRSTHSTHDTTPRRSIVFSRNSATPSRTSVTSHIIDIIVGVGQIVVVGNEIKVWREPDPSSKLDTITLDKTDVGILMSAAAAIRAGKLPRCRTLALERGALKDRGTLWRDRRLPDEETNRLCMFAAYLPLLYGACHAVAWNVHFPTAAERMLWRVSSVLVGVLPLMPWLIVYCKYLYNHRLLYVLFYVPANSFQSVTFFFNILSRILPPGVFRLVRRVWLRFCSLGLLVVLVAARGFLVVEAFISLRSLPVGSFQTTPWDQYWQHL
ncbi:hypothetical protein DFP73DRAFT_569321 [Morchella snyderi]|nr:hypothetical protein DFP73DRAFT_569321 [Morchella snyderi]